MSIPLRHLIVTLALGTAAAAPAFAGGGVSWSISVGGGYPGYGYYAPPAPVYYPPPPVYNNYSNYYAPPVVYGRAAPVYEPPPVVVYEAPRYYRPYPPPAVIYRYHEREYRDYRR